MNIKQEFGKKIKEKRILRKLTQEQLAERIGISPKSLSQIELGNNFVTADNIEKICNSLNISPKSLFDFSIEHSDELLENTIAKLKNNPYLLDKINKIIEIIE